MTKSDLYFNWVVNKKILILSMVFVLVISTLGIVSSADDDSDPKQLAGPTYVGGWINTTTTWIPANNPYIVTPTLSIGTTGVLYIQPGVEVQFVPSSSLNIWGHIYANGTSGSKILFTDDGNFSWDAIYVYTSDNSFQHCDITNNGDGLQLMGNTVNVLQNNLIESCDISGQWNYGLILNYADKNQILNTSLLLIGEAGNGVYLTSSNNNEFYNLNIDDTYGYSITLDNSSYNNFNIGWWNYPYTGAGLTLSANSHHNTFNDINISDVSPGGGYYSIEAVFSSDNTFVNCSIYNPTGEGLKVDNSQNILFQDSSIVTGTTNHISLYNGAESIFLNTVYDNTSVDYYDTSSTFLVQNYLTVEVLDNYNSDPVVGANVIVRNVTSAVVGNVFTDSNGMSPPVPASYFKNQDLNGNTIIELWEQIFYNPYNVTVNHPHYYQGFSEPDPWVDQNLFITIYLNELPVDEVIIRDAPNGGGTEVGDELYFIGDQFEFYAACYSDTFGYIGDLKSSWQSSNASVASVTTPGPTTMFEALANGTLQLTLNHRGVTNQSGLITVVMFNHAPNLTALPDRVLDEDQTLDNVVDLWTYAEDNETSNANLVFTIIANTEPDCGVSIDRNRYIDIAPTANWSGISNVTVEVLDGYSYEGTNKSTFQIIVNPVNDAPELHNGTIDPSFGEVDTVFNYTVLYFDIEDEAPVYINVMIDSVQHAMAHIDASDLLFNDSKEYRYLTTLPPGDDHTFQFEASDGTNVTSTGIFQAPDVAAPKLPDLCLTEWDIILSNDSPVIPNGTVLIINATIQNNGEVELSNVNVSFELKSRTRAYENWTMLGPEQVIPFIAAKGAENVSLNWTTSPPGNYRLRVTADPSNLIDEGDNETNNSAEIYINIGPDAGIVEYFEVRPKSWEMYEGETKQYEAIGYDFYNNQVPLDVTWDVSGGGTIDANGNFNADLWGTWEITASYAGMTMSVPVIVRPKQVELSEIVVVPDRWIMVVNDTNQFTAHAYDLNGTEVELNLDWELITGGGEITRNGLFTAQEAGKWELLAKYPAVNGEIAGNAVVTVLSSENDSIEESFTDPDAEIDVIALVSGSGTISVAKLEDPQVDIPEEMQDIGIFIEILKSETLELICAMIKIPFDSLNLPEGVDPNDIKIYYWDESEGTWILAEETWVEGNVVYANVTHFTIFAPMAESTEKESGEESDNTLMYAVVAIIIIIIIVVIIGALVHKKRPSEKEMLEAEEEQESEEEVLEVAKKKFELEVKKCPKCGEEIEVPISDGDKVSIKCSECGAKGRVPNPYLERLEKLRKKMEAELTDREAALKELGELEELDDWDAGDESEEDEDEDMEWAEDEGEEAYEDEDELDDWDKVAKEEEAAVEDLYVEKELAEEDEELDDWDAEATENKDEDEFEDWD